MPPPRGDVTALFLGPPGSGKSSLIAALCDSNVETVEIPEGRRDSGVPSLRAAGPGLFLGELSCPPAAPGPWAVEANVLVLVLPGPEGNGEPLAPALGEAARAALARGTPLLAVRKLRPGDSQNDAQIRDQTAALLDRAGLGAATLFVLPADFGGDHCEELDRLRGALRSQAEALQRLLPPAQDGFEVLGPAELEAVREAFETGGLEAALSWVRAGLERLGSARLDLAVAGTTNMDLVLNALLGLDPGDPGAVPASAPTGPTPFPAPERPNVVLWTVPLGSTGTSPASASHPTHYDAVILVTVGAPAEKDWAQVRALVSPDAPLVCVRTDGQGEDPPESLEEEEKGEKARGQSLEKAGEGALENAPREGKKNLGAGSQKAGDERLPQVVGAKTSGGGDSGRAGALSPEDEPWEVLEEAPPPVFPLRPGGLPGLCAWLQRALSPAQAGALLLALPPASPGAARRKAAALRAGAWRPALLASLAAAAAPIPGLGWACDVALLRGQLAEWRRALGLEPAALARRECALGLAPGELAAHAHFPGPVTRAEVEARLGAWAGEGTAGGAALGALSFLWPAGGAAATGGLGYRAAHGVLLQALDEMLADAEAVLASPDTRVSPSD